MTLTLTRAEVRKRLVHHLLLDKPQRSVRAVLEKLRCIQLDPLDLIGTNADLVAMARVDGIARGDVYRKLQPRYAFEHFAKERCLLPADAFPQYRKAGHSAQTPWWQHGERERRVPRKVVEAVLAEVRERGPVTARELTDHGRVEPLDWSGWMGTSKMTSMALEMLWTTLDVVVAGRREKEKLYDAPERALGTAIASAEPVEPFGPWALRERATAAGLLTRAGGSMWSMLRNVRTSPVVDHLLADGSLVEVTIEDSPRRYLATPSFLGKKRITFDDRVRILGPLDPLLWDRDLVRHAFGFEYVWEVYKPAKQRIWGWYVCPLLFRDRLVGRIDARVAGRVLRVDKLWIESDVDETLIHAALERHAEACGCDRVKVRKTIR